MVDVVIDWFLAPVLFQCFILWPEQRKENSLFLSNSVADLALSVAHYTPTLAEIYAAFPDTIASAFAAGKSSTVVVSLTLSLHLDEASGDLKTQSLKWAGSPGWKLSYAVDDMPSARVAIVQASLKRKVCELGLSSKGTLRRAFIV